MAYRLGVTIQKYIAKMMHLGLISDQFIVTSMSFLIPSDNFLPLLAYHSWLEYKYINIIKGTMLPCICWVVLAKAFSMCSTWCMHCGHMSLNCLLPGIFVLHCWRQGYRKQRVCHLAFSAMQRSRSFVLCLCPQVKHWKGIRILKCI